MALASDFSLAVEQVVLTPCIETDFSIANKLWV
jgi:hypothetical protein